MGYDRHFSFLLSSSSLSSSSHLWATLRRGEESPSRRRRRIGRRIGNKHRYDRPQCLYFSSYGRSCGGRACFLLLPPLSSFRGTFVHTKERKRKKTENQSEPCHQSRPLFPSFLKERRIGWRLWFSVFLWLHFSPPCSSFSFLFEGKGRKEQRRRGGWWATARNGMPNNVLGLFPSFSFLFEEKERPRLGRHWSCYFPPQSFLSFFLFRKRKTGGKRDGRIGSQTLVFFFLYLFDNKKENLPTSVWPIPSFSSLPFSLKEKEKRSHSRYLHQREMKIGRGCETTSVYSSFHRMKERR